MSRACVQTFCSYWQGGANVPQPEFSRDEISPRRPAGPSVEMTIAGETRGLEGILP